jgi:putative oxidoreductase
MRALQSFLGRYEAQIYAILRIVVGFLFACHGAQKLFGAFEGKTAYGNPLLMTAGVIEFGGGVLIALGLLTTLAAFIASGEMAVAYFKVHVWRGFWPIMNDGEKVVLFSFIFLFIAAHGAGIWSVDSVILGKKS